MPKLPFPCGAYDFIQGNEAIARGAVLAGCRFFAGYPITPASEILEALSAYMPLVGGVAIQMEDEIASLAAAIGASWAGVKAMTATSGPGFSLMMENLGYAIMTETPVVVVDVQRGGPSTGQPTMPSQGDVLQSIWGTHGDKALIVLAPSTVEEALQMTIRAFNLAEKYRTPVVLLTDGEVAHLREKAYVPSPEEVEVSYRRLPSTPEEARAPFKDWYGDGVPPMPIFGRGYRAHVTGLTHNERGLPAASSPEEHDKLVRRLVRKVERAKREIFSFKEFWLHDAEVVVVAQGVVARSSLEAVAELREEGVKAGLLKVEVLWPFDFDLVRAKVRRARRVVVPEMNLGQLYHLVKEALGPDFEIVPVNKIGGELPTPDEIKEACLS